MKILTILLLALASMPAFADLPDSLPGRWKGPCSDGRAERVQLGGQIRRVRASLEFTAEKHTIRSSFEFFQDDFCDRSYQLYFWTGDWGVEQDETAWLVSGVFEHAFIQALSSESAAALNDPAPFCSIERWRKGDLRDVSECDPLAQGIYSYSMVLLDNGGLRILGDESAPDLDLKRVSDSTH